MLAAVHSVLFSVAAVMNRSVVSYGRAVRLTEDYFSVALLFKSEEKRAEEWRKHFDFSKQSVVLGGAYSKQMSAHTLLVKRLVKVEAEAPRGFYKHNERKFSAVAFPAAIDGRVYAVNLVFAHNLTDVCEHSVLFFWFPP